jgi:elongation factor Ts
MVTISVDMIKKLREATNAGVLDCRKALETTGGDYDKALAVLREKGLATAAKRADRKASEGVIDVYSHGNGRVAVLVEVNCETDFVGRSEVFRTFAHELALQIAAQAPLYIRDEDIPQEWIEQESARVAAKARQEGKPENIIPRIVEGSLAKHKDEYVLLRQKYIRDDTKTIQDLLNETIVSTGENIVIRRFVRWALGETTQDD